MKKIYTLISIILLACAGLFAQSGVEIPDGPSFLFDGFENGNYWIWAGFDWDQYGSVKCSTGADISKDWASEGSHSLKMSMDVMDKDSTKSAIWFYDGTNDLSGAKYITMDFYNPEDYVYNINVVIQATDAWNWWSLEHYDLPKGKNTFVFDLSAHPERLNDVRRISIYNNSGEILMHESHIYVDNIRLIK